MMDIPQDEQLQISPENQKDTPPPEVASKGEDSVEVSARKDVSEASNADAIKITTPVNKTTLKKINSNIGNNNSEESEESTCTASDENTKKVITPLPAKPASADAVDVGATISWVSRQTTKCKHKSMPSSFQKKNYLYTLCYE